MWCVFVVGRTEKRGECGWIKKVLPWLSMAGAVLRACFGSPDRSCQVWRAFFFAEARHWTSLPARCDPLFAALPGDGRKERERWRPEAEPASDPPCIASFPPRGVGVLRIGPVHNPSPGSRVWVLWNARLRRGSSVLVAVHLIGECRISWKKTRLSAVVALASCHLFPFSGSSVAWRPADHALADHGHLAVLLL